MPLRKASDEEVEMVRRIIDKYWVDDTCLVGIESAMHENIGTTRLFGPPMEIQQTSIRGDGWMIRMRGVVTSFPTAWFDDDAAESRMVDELKRVSS